MGGRISYDKDDRARAKREGRALVAIGYDRGYVKDETGKLIGGSTITYQGVANDDFCYDLTAVMLKYEADGGPQQFAEKLEIALREAVPTMSPGQVVQMREAIARFSILPNIKSEKKR